MKHLDLNKELGGKLGKQLTNQRCAKSHRFKKAEGKTSWGDVVDRKERNVLPLNHSVGFWRLT